MKRIISAFLAILMLCAFASAFASVGAEEYKIVNYTNPVITANVGETVDLSEYRVQFEAGGGAVNVTWQTAPDQSEITELSASEKGVTTCYATNGDKGMTVFFVTKEKDENEFVLFEADFSKYTSISELKSDGYVTNADDKYYSFADGALVMGGIDHDYIRLMLPEWLGNFGDYSISADIKMLETRDTSRWFGLVYRIQNANNAYYPYYHMCLRENTTGSSGIEFAERTTSNAWNVATATSGSVKSLKDGFHTVNIKAFGTNVQYNLDGVEELFVSDAVIGKSAAKYEKGMIGITMNFGTVAVKNIKVTVQTAAPERPKKTLNLINNAHTELNLINPIANVERLTSEETLSVIESGESSGSVLIDAAAFDDLKGILAACIENQVLPTFILSSQDDVVKLNKAMNAHAAKDANAISSDPALLKNIRTNKPIVRTGLIIDLPEGELTSDAADELRRKVRSAPATFCVISSEDATYQAVDELQELAVAVWVDIKSAPDSAEYTVEALKAVTSGANGIISSDSAKLAETINKYLEKNTMTRTPVMIGHRGNPSQAPENSLSGFIKAYENGADVFEVDVEITKDGEIVIMHDSTLNRTTNYTGTATVNQMTLEEIKKYNLKALNGSISEEKVPTLREVFEEFKDKDCKIFVEFKGSNANNIQTTCDLIKEYGMEDKVDVISFSLNFLTLTQKNIPGMATGYLHSPASSGNTVEDTLEAFYPSLVTAQTNKSSINPSNGVVTPLYMQAAADRGITVWPWTYNLSSNDRAFLSGCDGVTTDDMQWVTKMAKYLTAPSLTIAPDAIADTDVKFITYGGQEAVIKSDKLIVNILSGEDVIKIEDGKITALKEGTATVMYGYKAKTTAGSEYLIYTQPTLITVQTPVNEPASDSQGISTDTVIIIISSIVAVLALAVGFVFLKKKK